MTQSAERKRVVVVGGGFGGLHAAMGLKHVDVDVTLVDRRNYHLFQPLLYQVALAVLSPADIAQPIRSIMRHNANVEVLMDEVVGFDTAAQRVKLKTGLELQYDFLVLATGSTHSYFGKDEWAAVAPGLKTIEDATEIRRRVLLAFELAERQMLEKGTHPALNFVIVGGGPTGVELAGAISDIAKLYMTKDFRHIDPSSAQVMILEGSPNILAAYPKDLQESAIRQLQQLGVKVRTGAHVTDVQPGYVMVGDERVDSVCTLWGAGVQASPLGKLLGAETDKRGCVLVDPFLNPKGLPNVFICGDLAHVEENGKQVPGVAQPAMQMGDYAAKRIAGMIDGKPLAKAFHYFDKGDMATIGRKAAVAKIEWPFKAHWSGFPAWMTWLVVHIFFLIGFRNRFSVFRQWAFTYLTFQDGARLITGSQVLPGWEVEDHPAGELTTVPVKQAS
jgi:NADH dehydrogenase